MDYNTLFIKLIMDDGFICELDIDTSLHDEEQSEFIQDGDNTSTAAATSAESGAPPEMKNFIFFPIFSFIFEYINLFARACLILSKKGNL